MTMMTITDNFQTDMALDPAIVRLASTFPPPTDRGTAPEHDGRPIQHGIRIRAEGTSGIRMDEGLTPASRRHANQPIQVLPVDEKDRPCQHYVHARDSIHRCRDWVLDRCKLNLGEDGRGEVDADGWLLGQVGSPSEAEGRRSSGVLERETRLGRRT